MISLNRWRWPVILTLPFSVLAFLVWHGEVRPVFESTATLHWSSGASIPPEEFSRLASEDVRRKVGVASGETAVRLRARRVPGHPLELALITEANWPKGASELARRAINVVAADQIARQKIRLHQKTAAIDDHLSQLALRLTALGNDYQAARQPLRPAPVKSNADSIAQLQELKTRRQLLIERFPTHPDIPKLAIQIQKLEIQAHTPRAAHFDTRALAGIGRAIAEIRVQMDALTLQKQMLATTAKALQPGWTVQSVAREGNWPRRLDGWPIGAGAFASLFLIAFFTTRGGRRKIDRAPFKDGLWRATSTIPLAVVPSGDDKGLQQAPWQVPDDPLSRQAASLYDQWLAVVQKLYEPAPEPPQRVMETIDPLVKNTIEFLPEGQEALSRCLARTIRPGELASHVTHTVLMGLIGTLEAGVSQEHGRAMALAALFHDLAIVPRPISALQEVGSEVGRLSAALVPKISGLTPALVTMIQEILIGMDEFKDTMWQNVTVGNNLEPLAKLLRQIDRFEKVMQKQSVRIQRRLRVAV